MTADAPTQPLKGGEMWNEEMGDFDFATVAQYFLMDFLIGLVVNKFSKFFAK